MNNFFLLLIATILCFACSSEKPTTAKGPSEATGVAVMSQRSPAATPLFALEIIPTDATHNSTLNIISRGFDLSRSKIEWTVNDQLFTTVEPSTFRGADAAKGDRIQARALVQGQVVMSNIVQIKNTPPEVTGIKLLPDVFKPSDTLYVEAGGKDVDGDSITFQYEWIKNGNPAGKEKNIETSIKRGDNIVIKITPFDGESYGQPVVIQRAIKNMPPVIEELKEFTFDGKVYTYQVKASDPDGDTLTYSLASPLSGMTIDTSNGLLKWIVPSDFTGVREVAVIVKDGNGGTAQYNLKITIK